MEELVRKWQYQLVSRQWRGATEEAMSRRNGAEKAAVEIGVMAQSARSALTPLGYKESYPPLKELLKRERWAGECVGLLQVSPKRAPTFAHRVANNHRAAIGWYKECLAIAEEGYTAKQRQYAKQEAVSHYNRAKKEGKLCLRHGPDCADARVMAILLRGDPCESCGKGSGIDHITPLDKNGEHCRDNLQSLCPNCNSRKGASETVNSSLLSKSQTVHIARQGNDLLTFASLEEALAWAASGTDRHLVTQSALRARAERAGKDYDVIMADLEARRAQRESETEMPSFPAVAQENPTRQPAYFAIGEQWLHVFDTQAEAAAYVKAGEGRVEVSESLLVADKGQKAVDNYVAAERARREANRRPGVVADGPPLRLTPSVGAASRRPARMGRRARLRRQGMRPLPGA